MAPWVLADEAIMCMKQLVGKRFGKRIQSLPRVVIKR